MDIDFLKNLKILIVDDKEANIIFLRLLFKREGFKQIITTTDSRKAIPLVTEEKPDIVLLDLMMPHLNGFEVMAQLKSVIPENEYLPILVLTADSTKESKQRSLNEGALDFLVKPLDATEVVQRTINLLHTRHLHQKQKLYNQELEDAVNNRTKELAKANLQLSDVNKALENASSEILERLARAAEYRDDNTGQHTHRVGSLSYEVARGLGLPDKFCELIMSAARLHDLGKLGIPDNILLKPGKLTDEEMTIMKTHCNIGAKLLSGGSGDLLKMAETIALTHHEHWDGKGYPQGLQGENIPIEGRIVAIVDVFDTLTHSRPYKKAWSKEDSINLIQHQSGFHFDPNIVPVFFKIIEKEA